MKRCILVLALASFAAMAPAHAHTNIVIAGFQIVPGGSVNGYGVAPNQSINDGPATDGTLIFTNADPVAHRIVECRPCGLTPTVPTNPALDVTIAPGESKTVNLPAFSGIRTYELFDPAYPTMRAKVRHTGGEG